MSEGHGHHGHGAHGGEARGTSMHVSAAPGPRSKLVPVAIASGVLALLGIGGVMLAHSRAATNQVALAAEPKQVGVVETKGATYRATRRYVATVEPWLRAKVGPQLIAAYVDTVLFRPGAAVKRGEVLATLDCRNASAASRSVAMVARALEAKQAAIAKEASRVESMLDGGFVSENEVERKRAESATQQAELLAAKAKLLGTSLEVDDCVLKAPFDGEIDQRMVDPGAFVRPGAPIVSLVDRSMVRVTADVPEVDFEAVAEGTPVKMRLLSTGQKLTGKIARRAPAADIATRTVHVEIDLADPNRTIPVGTTAELQVDVGDPAASTELPLTAALVRGDKATVFVIEGDTAKKKVFHVLGEKGGSLFVDTSLPAGSKVVVEGRGLLADGDHVNAHAIAAGADAGAGGGAKSATGAASATAHEDAPSASAKPDAKGGDSAPAKASPLPNAKPSTDAVHPAKAQVPSNREQGS